MFRSRYTLTKDADRMMIFASWTLYGVLLTVALLADGIAATI